MELPFTEAEFFAVFARYNEAVWPAQVVLLGLALLAAGLTGLGGRRGAKGSLAILAILWLWMGAVYHGRFFRPINPAAAAFMALFLFQGLLLLGAAFIRTFEARAMDPPGLIGGALVVYAIVVYPAMGYMLGHRYPATPTFGLPCPTTLFTLGLLLWMRPVSWTLMLVPLAWTVVGTSAAIQLGVPQDFGLAAGGVATGLGVLLARRAAKTTPGEVAIA